MTQSRNRFVDLINRHSWPKAIAVTGALGSGKTEWVLNLALGFSSVGEDVTIADVDIINPYFCIRQVSETLEDSGFKVLTAPDSAKWADMPLVTAQVDWALSEPNGRLLMDVGGDAEGALALKKYKDRMMSAGYLLILVVNAYRPMTSTVEGISKMRRRMEEIGELEVGALICNSHLMAETTVDVVEEGLRLVEAAGKEMDLPVLYTGVPPQLDDEAVRRFAGREAFPWPVSRYMLLPWEKGAMWSTGVPSKNQGARILRQEADKG
ncbi:putative ATP/GTP-binding protein [Dethiosulfovibrio peptidovorans DSM 11002]|uniref:ATP/GTP-binding protein n=1 Tax=Dethiosulfovibrio peptidovorans DSM 11002 TaxID=469381 RepID=D2Z407_9BACT|nr:hypothetical protein [Dethiosulfovibrio peptidovorans]EFC92268.1 putative ATP/GTP-binding protein [Dethiosulfovibrio peptidovorans DSM 11002]